MYFVGIDISKFKHDCFIVDNNGKVIVSSWSFANDQEGFLLFKEILDGLEGEIRIGFESTGHYTDNIRLFLERHHFSFMELNPLLISRFNNSKSLRKTKSDTIDAALIAQYLMTVEYKPNPPTLYHIEALKSLTRFRDKLVKLRSRQLVELTNILDKIFPEFKPFFSNRFSATAIYIIANYQTPESIANMNSRSFELLRKKSRGKFTMAKFIQLKELAKNTVGNSSDYLIDELNMVIDIYSQLDSKICEIEALIKEYIADINPPMLSIPGIGPFSAAVILSEYGDINNFDSPAKMLSFAGLEPGYYQSGVSEHTGKMVKHGSGHLRATLMNCCLPLISHDLIFAQYYSKKRAEGKSHRVALSHVAKKLVRVIYTLQTKNTTYDSSLIR